MEQRSESWEQWRKKGIGASDCPIIMGVSPWMTPYQLWEQKTGRATGFKGNWATKRGNDMEPVARRHYELLTDDDMPPALMVHPEYKYMKASLDGWNGKYPLEIKCPGAKDHLQAKENIVPEKYKWQVQHQIFVTGAEKAHYYSFDGEEGVLIEVARDEKMIAQLLEACTKFWNEYVEKDTPPPLTDKDFVLVRDPELAKVADEYKTTKRLVDSLAAKLDELKETLSKQYLDHPRFVVNGVQIIRSQRKGAIDYTKIPGIEFQDLELLRKKPVQFTTVSIRDKE